MASSATSSITIQARTFINPGDSCGVQFTWSDTYSMTDTFTIIATPNTISGLVATPSSGSLVGGYYSLDIAFNLPTDLKNTYVIQMSALNFQDSSTGCSNTVPKNPTLSAAYSCSYTSGSSLISITYNGATPITSSTSLTFTINNVQYNTKMSPKTLTVSITRGASCLIATGTDSTNWVPKNPAAFNILTLAYTNTSPTSVCSTGAIIKVSFTPTIALASGSAISVTFVGLTPNSGFSFSAWNNQRIVGQVVSGTLASTYSTSSYFLGNPLTLSTTEQTYYVYVTAYAGSTMSPGEIVYNQTTNTLNAVRSKSYSVLHYYRNNHNNID